MNANSENTYPAIRPLTLSPNERTELDVLYLAKFAPEEGQTEAALDADYPRLARYHFDLFTTLKALELRVTPCADLRGALSGFANYNYIFSVENSAPFRNSELAASTVAEAYSIRYLGAPPNVRAIAEDKYLSNIYARALGIRTPQQVVFPEGQAKQPPFAGPYIVKPRFGVNSEDMPEDCVQDQWEDILKRCRTLSESGIEALVESFIPGDNATSPFVDGVPPQVMPVIAGADLGGHNVFTRRHKQDPQVFSQGRLIDDGAEVQQIRASNATLRRHLGAVDYFRADWRIERITRVPYLIEINICCNISESSDMARACSTLGWTYPQMVENLVAASIRRKKSRR